MCPDKVFAVFYKEGKTGPIFVNSRNGILLMDKRMSLMTMMFEARKHGMSLNYAYFRLARGSPINFDPLTEILPIEVKE